MGEAAEGAVDETRLDNFEQRVEVPMMILSVVFLADLVVPVIDPHLPTAWSRLLQVLSGVVWAVFVAEYLTRLYLARQRVHFVTHNLVDLLVIAVPVLRPVRFARLVRVLRFARVGALVASASRRSNRRFHVDLAAQVVVIAVLILFVGAVAMLDVERNAPGSTIRTFGDALWWALTTVTTVGYGDKVPVTGQGRLIAAAVMVTGIAVIGVVTASVAGWIMERLRTIEQSEAQDAVTTEALAQKLDDVLLRLSAIEAALGQRSDSVR